MRKLIGTKQKMTQIFKDGAALGVTPVKLAEKSNLEGLDSGMEIKVSGTSKGHGFSSVIKRWNFRGGPRTHGNKHHERAPGSIGSKNMARVVKGRKMAGRYGMERISYKGIKIADINADNGIIMIHGSAPGIVGRSVEIVAPVEGPSIVEAMGNGQEAVVEQTKEEVKDDKEKAREETKEEPKDEGKPTEKAKETNA
jgi:hypothetical protein